MVGAKINHRPLLSQQIMAEQKFPTLQKISVLQMVFSLELFMDGNCLSRRNMKRVEKNMAVARFFLVVPLVGLLLLGGCGQWSKSGATRMELAQDRYQCLHVDTVFQVDRWC